VPADSSSIVIKVLQRTAYTAQRSSYNYTTYSYGSYGSYTSYTLGGVPVYIRVPACISYDDLVRTIATHLE
jgi:hypothetical protein